MKGYLPADVTAAAQLEPANADRAVLYPPANAVASRYRNGSAARNRLRTQPQSSDIGAQEQLQKGARITAEALAQDAQFAAQQAWQTARFHQAQARRALGRQRREDWEREQALGEAALARAEELSLRAAHARVEAAQSARAEQAAHVHARAEAQAMTAAKESGKDSTQRHTAHQDLVAVTVKASPGNVTGERAASGSALPRVPTRVLRPGDAHPDLAADMQPERFPQRRSPRWMTPPQGQDPASVPPPPEFAGARGVVRLPRRSRERGLTLASRAASAVREGAQRPVPAWIGEPASLTPLATPGRAILSHILPLFDSARGAQGGTARADADLVARNSQAARREDGSPLLALFSLAGGVGRTTVAACLGRALAGHGERPLLVSVAAQSTLSFYFGAKDSRPGTLRTFAPPGDAGGASVSLIDFAWARGGDQEDEVAGDLLAALEGSFDGYRHRVVDLSPAATGTLRRLTALGAAVLVPLTPDMSSVLSLRSVERFLAGVQDGAGRPVRPRYLLTQFEASEPLHLHVREVMRRKLGERLLPFTIRRSPKIAAALSEGMTVLDYAPQPGIAEDFQHLADWFRRLGAPSTAGR